MKRFLVLLAVFFVCSCAKSSSPTDSNGGNTTPVGDDYFQASFGGKSILLNPQQGGANGQATGFEETSGSYYYMQAYRYFYFDNRGKPLAGKPAAKLWFAKQYTQPASYTNYAGIVYKGAMPFGNRNMKTDGVVIEYTDASGHNWASDNGLADQTGSSFVVVTHDSTKAYPYPPYPHFRSKGTFECTLYDSLNNTLKVTGGTFGAWTHYYVN